MQEISQRYFWITKIPVQPKVWPAIIYRAKSRKQRRPGVNLVCCCCSVLDCNQVRSKNKEKGIFVYRRCALGVLVYLFTTFGYSWIIMGQIIYYFCLTSSPSVKKICFSLTSNKLLHLSLTLTMTSSKTRWFGLMGRTEEHSFHFEC